MKSRARQLYMEVKAKPESETFLALIELIDGLNYETLEKMVTCTETDELLRLQGQARCLSNLNTNLTRKTVTNTLHNG